CCRWARRSLLQQRPGWTDLLAVQNNQVYLCDFDLFTQPSAATLVDGITLLAALFHPQLFTVPAHLQHKYHHLTTNLKALHL
ncbi:MAG: hypothetical protein SFU21_10615, partial [Flavihumibacter sp.]|nr:hypothetical protein [Flavihumibacter sp.]